MTIQLIATGRPCEICKTAARQADDGAAPSVERPPSHLEPRELPFGNDGSTVTVGDGYLGAAPDKQVFRVERDGKDVGVFCAKCLRAACETATGTGQIGVEVVVSMRDRAAQAP